MSSAMDGGNCAILVCRGMLLLDSEVVIEALMFEGRELLPRYRTDLIFHRINVIPIAVYFHDRHSGKQPACRR